MEDDGQVSQPEGTPPPPPTTFDDVIKSLGDFGRYQKRVFLLMSLLPMTVGIQTIMTVFTLATPAHRCAVPEIPNDTYAAQSAAHEQLLNASIPWEMDDDGTPVRSRCLLYRNRKPAALGGTLLSNRSTVACSSWVFDRSTFDVTFTEETGLVCDKKHFHAIADMLYMVGMLAGALLVGIFSDRFGRKLALMAALLLHVSCAVGISFVTSFPAFATLRFCLGMSSVTFLVAYVLGLELVGAPYRTVTGSLLQMAWPVGLFLQTAVAYGLRDWSQLQLALSCPSILFLLYFWCVKESPRWLMSQNKIDEAYVILEQVAKVNGKPPPSRTQGGSSQPEVKKESFLRMFTNRITLTRTVILLINWVVVTMVYYGLSLNVGSLGSNIYLNNFLSALAELIGYVIALLGLDRLGRKAMHCGSMILGGLSCVCTVFPVIYGNQGLSWLVLVLSNAGKMGASSAFCIVYLLSAELYPTVVRNSMLGISSTVARIGGIMAPYIAQLNVIVAGHLGVALPLVVFGGSALVAGLLALLLPETLGRPLPETVEDAIHYESKYSWWTVHSKDNDRGLQGQQKISNSRWTVHSKDNDRGLQDQQKISDSRWTVHSKDNDRGLQDQQKISDSRWTVHSKENDRGLQDQQKISDSRWTVHSKENTRGLQSQQKIKKSSDGTPHVATVAYDSVGRLIPDVVWDQLPPPHVPTRVVQQKLPAGLKVGQQKQWRTPRVMNVSRRHEHRCTPTRPSKRRNPQSSYPSCSH